ncbi:MAG: thioredoxin fold domain-containing protein [Myxococcales bacterium]|nr:thioredoxin fold domain-containing protein [Myxococcales bacterium]MCB9644811.1 thioredoxin fold domain-containing protein [Myxococcales bacterium]
MELQSFGIYGAGLLTFFTPCVLPLIPVYFSMLLGGPLHQVQAEGSLKGKLLGHTILFSMGFLLVFILLGLSATTLGRFLGNHREAMTLGGGLLIFLFGLKFLGFLHIDLLNREKRLDDRKLGLSTGVLNSFVMGFVFALGWTPCVGPLLGAVLTYTAAKTSNPWMGGWYLFLYGLGFATPLWLASLGAGTILPMMRRLMRFLPRIEKATGALLAGVGVYVMFSVLTPPTAPNQPQAKLISSPNPLSKAIQKTAKTKLSTASARPKMVEFVSSHCPICRQMIPIVASVEQECTDPDKGVEVIKIDISQPEHQHLAQRFRIRGVPTFVFLHPQGHEVARLIGYQRRASLHQALALLTGEQCRGLGRVPSKAPTSQPTSQSTIQTSKAPVEGKACSTTPDGKACGTPTTPAEGQACGTNTSSSAACSSPPSTQPTH